MDTVVNRLFGSKGSTVKAQQYVAPHARAGEEVTMDEDAPCGMEPHRLRIARVSLDQL